MDIIDCPHCLSRILPGKNGICPSCQKDINDRSLIEKSRKQAALREEIDQLRLGGKSLPSALKQLGNGKYDHALIGEVGGEYERDLALYRFEVKKMYLLPGIPAFLIGVIVSFVTIFNMEKTGMGILWYGLIFYGLLSTMMGLVKLYKAR